MLAYSSFADSLPLLLTVSIVGSTCEHISLKLVARGSSVLISLKLVSCFKKGRRSISLSL